MLSVALLASTLVLQAPAAPDVRERAKNRAFELVAELGNPSFKMREKAADDLVRLGSAAVDALKKGVNHPDTEVGERCRRLLPQALDFHLQEQIAIFLAKPDAPIPEDLPGIQRWIKIAGKGKESRELYSLMVKEQRRILIDIEANPTAAHQRYQAFCREVYDRMRGAVSADGRMGVATQSELLLFLFLGADPAIRKAAPANAVIYAQATQFLNSTHLPGMLSGVGASDASKKIFLGWLEQERYLTLVRRGYQLAAAADLKEAAPMAVKVAADKTLPATSRAYALMGAAKLFTAANVKDLETLMQDKTIIGTTTLNNERITAELRDVALGLAVIATGQQAADYGFDRLRLNPAAINTSYIYFAISDKKRDEAHKKWQEWREKEKK